MSNLGPYELKGELGKGAMATVWRAYDPNLDREVAIKEPDLPKGIDDVTKADLSQRFVREGRAAAKLDHPNIITIYAADVFDGRPAIIMELVEGSTLADILDQRPPDPNFTLSVIDQLLDAVSYAHQSGIVHRDIKPDNIFIGSDGRVKLADFGIAQMGQGATNLTQEGTVTGTPGYMSPEQVRAEPVDHRSDLFSVGIIAYEMITGSNPFGASDGNDATSIMYKIVHEPTPDPRAVLNTDDIPPQLAETILTSTNKDPAYRFDGADSMRLAWRGEGATAGGGGAATAPSSAQATMAPRQQQQNPTILPQGQSPAAVSAPTKKTLPPNVMYGLGGVAVAIIGIALVLMGGNSGGGKTEFTAVNDAPPTPPAAATADVEVVATPAPAPPPVVTLDAQQSFDLLSDHQSRIGLFDSDISTIAVTDFNGELRPDGSGVTATTENKARDLESALVVNSTELRNAQGTIHSDYEIEAGSLLYLYHLCERRIHAVVLASEDSRSGSPRSWIDSYLADGSSANKEFEAQFFSLELRAP